MWSEWTSPIPATIGASTRSLRNVEISVKIPFEISWSVPTYRLDCVAVGYSGVTTGAFWDSCWWLRVGTVHPCPLVPHSLSYSASHRHFTTFGLVVASGASFSQAGASLAHTSVAVVGYSRCSHRHSERIQPVVRAEASAHAKRPGRLRSLMS